MVNGNPKNSRLNDWHAQLTARQQELADKQPHVTLAEDQEHTALYQMDGALQAYEATPQADRDADKGVLYVVTDLDNKLQAAVYTSYEPETGVANVVMSGALDQAARVKALTFAAQHFDGKAERIDASAWDDDKDAMAGFEAAGFKRVPVQTAGLARYVYGKEGQTTREQAREARLSKEHSDKILGASKASARLLGYDPDLVEVSDQEHPFKIGDENKQRYAAGLAHLDTGKITIFPKHVYSTDSAVSVMAHEVAHQKYQDVVDAISKETHAIFDDPGPPPNPNAEHRPQQLGGKDAVTAPDGKPYPPYDEKYPIYTRFQKYDDQSEKMIKDDGITEYSKAYWEHAAPGMPKQISLLTARHETIAEMARRLTDTGKLEGSPVWRRYYRDVDKTYAELQAAKKAA